MGHVPDRRRLLLHPRLPAVDRLRERRPARAAGHRRAGAGHAVRRPAGLLATSPASRRTGRARSACWSGCVSGWGGKVLVLVLLGFAATDFVITKTLSAADAAVHLDREPALAVACRRLGERQTGSRSCVTMVLLVLLGGDVPARLRRGDRPGGGHRRRLPGAQRDRHRQRPGLPASSTRDSLQTVVRPAWQAGDVAPARHGRSAGRRAAGTIARRLPAPLPEAGPGPVAGSRPAWRSCR